MFEFQFKFHWSLPVTDQSSTSIGSGNGLVPNTVWHQAITWTNDVQFTNTYLYHQGVLLWKQFSQTNIEFGTWISNHIHIRTWEVFSLLCLNNNRCLAFKFWAWKTNYIHQKSRDVISCLGQNMTYRVAGLCIDSSDAYAQRIYNIWQCKYFKMAFPQTGIFSNGIMYWHCLGSTQAPPKVDASTRTFHFGRCLNNDTVILTMMPFHIRQRCVSFCKRMPSGSIWSTSSKYCIGKGVWQQIWSSCLTFQQHCYNLQPSAMMWWCEFRYQTQWGLKKWLTFCTQYLKMHCMKIIVIWCKPDNRITCQGPDSI